MSWQAHTEGAPHCHERGDGENDERELPAESKSNRDAADKHAQVSVTQQHTRSDHRIEGPVRYGNRRLHRNVDTNATSCKEVSR